MRRRYGNESGKACLPRNPNAVDQAYLPHRCALGGAVTRDVPVGTLSNTSTRRITQFGPEPLQRFRGGNKAPSL